MAISVQSSLSRADRLTRRGQHEEAACILRGVLARHPGNQRAQRRLASLPGAGRLARLKALCARGDWQEARQAAEALCASEPGNAAAQALRAAICLASGADDSAIDAAAAALRADPDHGAAALTLGRALLRKQRPDDAVTCFLDCLRVDPACIPAHRALGAAWGLWDRPDLSAESYQRAVDLGAHDPDLLRSLAEMRAASGQGTAARIAFDAALDLAPHDPGLKTRRAVLLKNSGDTAAARQGFVDALQDDPGHPGAWANLARLHRFTSDDPLFAALDRAAAAPGLEPRARAHLLFARAKAHEDCGATAQAFDDLLCANALTADLVRHDPAEDARQHARIRAAFSETLPSPAAPARADGAASVPIFILGMPRSGTTLCEQILASHPGVRALGELDLLAPAVNAATIGAGPVAPAQLDLIRHRYLSRLTDLAPGCGHVTDKMPFNYRLIGHILLALPEALILHLRRDPRATCWSIFRTDFDDGGPALKYAWNLAAIAEHHLLHDAMMAFWHQRFPGRIHTVEYEALTHAPEPGIRDILGYCGLAWDAACLRPHETRRTVRTASDLQIRQPIYRGSSHGWRRYQPRLDMLTDIWGTGDTAAPSPPPRGVIWAAEAPT